RDYAAVALGLTGRDEQRLRAGRDLLRLESERAFAGHELIRQVAHGSIGKADVLADARLRARDDPQAFRDLVEIALYVDHLERESPEAAVDDDERAQRILEIGALPLDLFVDVGRQVLELGVVRRQRRRELDRAAVELAV